MKRILVALALVCAFLLTACSPAEMEQNYDLEQMGAVIGTDITSGEVQSFEDSHGGFDGAGVTRMVLSFADNSFEEGISGSEIWLALPLSTDLVGLVYVTREGSATIGPYFPLDEENNTIIPSIKNGYYVFFDRHSEATSRTDEAAWLERDSKNLTLAVYDSDEDLLYYLELDT